MCLFCVCLCVPVICYRADEKKTSVPTSHHPARRLLYLLPESPSATDKCERACARAHTHKQCKEHLCVSYCWCPCRHSWEGRVLCNQQQSWPFALDFLSSSVLQSKKKRHIEDERATLWFPWRVARPQLVFPPLELRNKTPSDVRVSRPTNLHPWCPLIDWPQ